MIAADDNTVVHYAHQNAEGSQEVHVTLTESSDTRTKQIVCAPLFAIPVVFVPGVMGTNLRVKDQAVDTNNAVWRPPNSTIGGLPMLFEFFFKGPKQRQERFNPANAEVDWNGSIDAGSVKLHEAEGTVATLRKRGWGSVHADSYHGLLQQLHLQLNDIALPQALAKGSPLPAFWNQLMQDPKAWGSTQEAKALKPEQLRQLCRYRFDVWACGYNWLQSNLQSGKDLHAYIQKVLQTYKNAGCVHEGDPPMKAIVVTHSMGGLVLRGLLQIPGAANNILGVVHGVQPAAGAPAVYKRMRAGFEGIEQVVLGRDAAEAVPVLSNAAALLEMLPFANYHWDQPWLKAGPHEWPAKVTGQSANPYKDIYANPAWYGLIPERNNTLIDPAGIVAKRIGPEMSVRMNFNTAITRVKTFHTAITTPGQDYHPRTWVHGAVGLSRPTWGEVRWIGSVPDGADLGKATLLQDDGDDRIELSGSVYLRIDEPRHAGDGTVPAWSVIAPNGRVQDLMLHGDGSVHGEHGLNARRATAPEAQALQPGYEHQNSYKDPRALWATVYAITQASQQANWAPVPNTASINKD